MKAACKPDSTTATKAAAATAVLPLPTSPCTNRRIGRGWIQVGLQLVDHAPLCGSELERQHLGDDPVDPLRARDPVRLALPSGALAGHGQSQLEAEKLAVDESSMGAARPTVELFHIDALGRPMQRFERPPQRSESMPRQELSG